MTKELLIKGQALLQEIEETKKSLEILNSEPTVNIRVKGTPLYIPPSAVRVIHIATVKAVKIELEVLERAFNELK